MKIIRSIITLLALLIMMSVSARTLTPEEALTRLRDANSIQRIPTLTGMTSPQLVRTISDRKAQPAVYIFANESGAYMLLSANDLGATLLGYGDGKAESDFANMPPQMQWWLNEYAEALAYADSVAALPASKNMKLRGLGSAEATSSRRQTVRSSIAPLLTTTWDQGAPYNDLCPLQDGTRTYTGCVATAMAQVMNYFEWPTSTTGTGYATVGGTTVSRSLNATYDWANMKDDYSESYTTKQKTAVSTLMVNSGYATEMNYSTTGSGTSDMKAARALATTFQYDAATWLYSRDNYLTEDWESMLYDNLTSCGPILYCGASSEGGHAFVCDGYQNGYFHFNWGWSGYYDGYFMIDALNPEGQGIGGFEGGYNTDQSAILGVRRPVAGSTRPAVQLTQYSELSPSISSSVITLNTKWYNMTYTAENLEIGYEFENITTEEKYYADYIYNGTFEPLQGFSAIQFPLSSSYPAGIYACRLVTRPQGTSEWMPALHSTSITDLVYLEKSSSGWAVTTDPTEEEEGVFISDFRFNDEQLYKGIQSSYTIIIRNTTKSTFSRKLAVGLIEGNSLVAVSESADDVTITVPAGATVEKTVPFTFTRFTSDFEYGKDYVFVLYDPDAMALVWSYGAVTIEEEMPDEGEILLLEMHLNDAQLYKDVESSYFIALENTTQKTYTQTFAAALIDENYHIMARTDASEYATIIAGPGENVKKTVNFTFSSFTDGFVFGEEYTFVLYDPEAMSILTSIDNISVKESKTPDQPENEDFEVTEDFTKTTTGLPVGTSASPTTDTDFTSSDTGITYTMKGCYISSYNGNNFLMINGKNTTGAFISFKLDAYCSAIVLTTSSSCSTNAKSAVNVYADNNLLGKYTVNEQNGKFTVEIPTQYRTTGTTYKIESATTGYNQQFSGFSYVCHKGADQSGIDFIISDPEETSVTVYTMQGIRLNIATREELSNLQPGLYIVNGQKVLIK